MASSLENPELSTRQGESFDGSGDQSTVSYINSTIYVLVNLGTDKGTYGLAARDNLAGIENVIGSDHNDTLNGDEFANTLVGGLGGDKLYGHGKDDTLIGGAGNDRLEGGAGNDILHGGAGRDTMLGGAGIDTVTYADSPDRNGDGKGITITLGVAVVSGDDAGTGGNLDQIDSIENVIGSAFADTITGDNNDNVLVGNAGNDELAGGGGNDILHGGVGGDSLYGNAGADTATYEDSLDTNNDGRGVTINLGEDGGGASGDDAQGDKLYGIEHVTGSALDDTITGDNKHNVLVGNAGNDELAGGGGSDFMYGGDGNDMFDGGAGSDYMYGHKGDDTFDAGDTGRDTMFGGGFTIEIQVGHGIDTVSYARSEDTNQDELGVTIDLSNLEVFVASGVNLMGVLGEGDGAEGDILRSIENIIGSAFADTITGGDGGEHDGVNVLRGLAGDDILRGKGGADRLYGGEGDDTLEGGAGADFLDGGENDGDSDTLSYATSDAGVVVNLIDNSLSGGHADSDSMVKGSFENIRGSEEDDRFVGDTRDNILIGGGGDDTLYGNAGNDILEGGDGEDDDYVFEGNYGADTVQNDADGGFLRFFNAAGIGDFTFSRADNNNVVITTVSNSVTGSVTILADATAYKHGRYTLQQGSGSDIKTLGKLTVATTDGGTIEASTDDIQDIMVGLIGDDTLRGNAGADTLYGGLGDDNLYGGANDDTLYGGLGADNLYGGANDDTLYGGGGGDTLEGGEGADILYGGGGGDTLRGDAGEDMLYGGDNVDTLEGGAGADTLDGGDGNDFLEGGAGADTYIFRGDFGADTIRAEEGTGNKIYLRAVEDAGTIVFAREDNGDVTITHDSGSVRILAAAYDHGRYSIYYGDLNTPFGRLSISMPGGERIEKIADDVADRMLGGVGNDNFKGGGGADRLYGGEGDDTLEGGAGADFLDGGEGDSDTISYAGSTDGVIVNLQDNTLSGGHATDSVSGVDVNDEMVAGSFENIRGSGHADTLTGDEFANEISGGGGVDTLDGGAGDDTLEGGAGVDTLDGGAGDDTLEGGADADTYVFRSGGGADTIKGDDGGILSFVDVDAAGTGDFIFSRTDNNDVVITHGSSSATILAAAYADGSYTLQVGSGSAIKTLGKLTVATTEGGAIASTGDLQDLMVGLIGADTLDGGAGADTLFGGDGVDTLIGGADADTLYGGDDVDTLQGNAGADTLDGGGGNDFLEGGGADDTYVFRGDYGADTIQEDEDGGILSFVDAVSFDDFAFSRADADSDVVITTVSNTVTGSVTILTTAYADGKYTLQHGSGSETKTLGKLTVATTEGGLIAGTGDLQDLMVGSIGDDTLQGNAGADTLFGGLGVDTLEGGAGADTLYGGEGDDTLEGGVGADFLDGGEGEGDSDTISYKSSDAGVIVNLQENTLSGGHATDSVSGVDVNDEMVAGSFENIRGSEEADTLTGDEFANEISGGGGADTLDGGAGDDTLAGGAGVDTYVFRSGGGADTIDGDDGGILSFVDVDAAGIGDFTFSRTDNNDVVITHGSSSATILAADYADGIYTLQVGIGEDLKTLGKLKFGTNVNDNGDNELVGTGEGDVLLGLLGDDTLDGGAGADTLFGGEQQDTLKGSAGNDRLYGGVGVDMLYGGADDDTLDGGLHDDILYGGVGADTYVFRGDFGADTIRGDTEDGGILSFVDVTNLADLTFVRNTEGGEQTLVISIGDNSVVIENYDDGLFGLSYGSGSEITTLGVLTPGSDGDDDLTGSTEGDVLLGLGGDDILNGEGGEDELYGGLGDDRLEGGDGADELYGGLGDDTLEGGADGDKFDGGDGDDTISYENSAVGVAVNLGTNRFSGGDADRDSLLVLGSVENLRGSEKDDTLTGDAEANRLTGGDGADRLRGGAGGDILVGGKGVDTYVTGAGAKRDYDLILDGAEAGVVNKIVFETFGAGYNAFGHPIQPIDDNNVVNPFLTITLVDSDIVTISMGSILLNQGTYNADLSRLVIYELIPDIASLTIENFVNGSYEVFTDSGGDERSRGILSAVEETAEGVDPVAFNGDTTDDGGVVVARKDYIIGSVGDDIINGLGEADWIEGGMGADVIDGGAGADTIYGGLGDDIIHGGSGRSVLHGGDGADRIYGGDDAGSSLRGDGGNDILIGGAIGERFIGGEGNDFYYGGAGGDDIFDNDDNDGSGDDFVEGGAGDDGIHLGEGIDTASYEHSPASDGSMGVTVDLSVKIGNLGIVRPTGGDADGDALRDVENLIGSDHDDTLTGDDGGDHEGVNVLRGLGGADTLEGGGGNDILEGGVGADTYVFGENWGADTIRGDTYKGWDLTQAWNSDSYTGPVFQFENGIQGDTDGGTLNFKDLTSLDGLSFDLSTQEGVGQTLVVSLGDNSITIEGYAAGLFGLSYGTGDDLKIFGKLTLGTDGVDDLVGADVGGLILGLAGDDTLKGGAGKDDLFGGLGDDVIEGGAGADFLDGGESDGDSDTISYATSDALVVVNLFDNTLSGGHATDSVDATLNDKMVKGSFENIRGSEHNDRLTGDTRANILSGGGGNDYLYGHAGNDILEGGGGEGDEYRFEGDYGADTVQNDADGGFLQFLSAGGLGDFTFSRADADSDVVITTVSNSDTGSVTILANAYENGKYTLQVGLGSETKTLGKLTVATTEGGLIESTEDQQDLMVGSIGNDMLKGGAGADRLYGGLGDDTIEGGAGADFLDGGEGEGDSDSDTISYAGSNARVIVNLFDNSLSGGHATDSVSNMNDEMVKGSFENIIGSDHNDGLSGDTRDNIISGGEGDDYLYGNAGNDILEGGADTDTYGFEGNYGADTVQNDADGGFLRFLNAKGLGDFTFSRDINSNVVITTVSNSDRGTLTGSVTILADTTAYDHGRYTLRQGFGADIKTLGKLTVATTDGGTITAEEGDLQDIMVGSIGNDELQGGGGADTLYGGEGVDTLLGGADADTLDGGGGNDFLEGGAGADTYIFRGDFGADTIRAEEGTDSKIYLRAVENPETLVFAREDNGDVTISHDSGSVTILAAAYADGRYSIHYGSEDTLLGKLKIVTNGIDAPLTGTAEGDFLVGLAGNDTLQGNAGADRLFGGEGDDQLEGGAGADRLYGGLGDDVIEGGAGADFLDGGESDGDSDTISYATSGEGVIVNLEPRFNSLSGGHATETIDNVVVNDKMAVGSFENIIGSGHDDSLSGDTGVNILIGGVGNDRLYGNAGNDILEGGDGKSDEYQFEGGYDADTIQNDADGGFLRFLNAAGIGDFTFSRDINSNVVITTVSNTVTGSVTILAAETAYDHGRYTLRQGFGADIKTLGKLTVATTEGGTIEASTDDIQDIMVGLIGDDTLRGNAGADRLYGGGGNDFLEGGAGADTYIFRGDFGADTIRSDTDGGILSFVDATNLADLTFALDTTANTLVISLVDNSVVIEGYADGRFDLSYGSGSEITTFGKLTLGTDEGAALVGTAEGDVLLGLAGDDRLEGGAGEDELFGGLGDDTLEGGADGDTFDGGEGDDTISYENSAVGVDVNLGTNTFSDGDAAEDSLFAYDDSGVVPSNIENLRGSNHNDVLTGDAEANRLTGGDGVDRLQGGAGGDILVGGKGVDTYVIGAGAKRDYDLILDGAEAGVVNKIVFEAFGAGYNALGNPIQDIDDNNVMNPFLTATFVDSDIVTISMSSRLLTQGIYDEDGNPLIIYEDLLDIASLTIENFVNGGYEVFVKSSPGDGDGTSRGIFSAVEETAYGEGGALDGGAGKDYILGSAGDDIIKGLGEADYIEGGMGNDDLQGGADADTLYGGDGDDTLQGGAGADRLYGGVGDDRLEGGAGVDFLDGGEGEGDSDTISYATSNAGVIVNLFDNTLSGGHATETIDNVVVNDEMVKGSFENIRGSKHNDRLTGDTRDNILSGGGGKDTLYGNAGNDILEGGVGEDDDYIFEGNYGADTVQNDADGGFLRFFNAKGIGDFTFSRADNNNVVITTVSNSDRGTLTGSVTILAAETAYDHGRYTLQQGFGAETKTLGKLTAATTEGGTIVASADDLQDIMVGSIGNDELQGGGGADTLYGGLGDDTLEGGAGADFLDGGEGDSDTISYATSDAGVIVNLLENTLSGGHATDSVDGVDVNDEMVAGSFENIEGSGHDDTLTGDAGANRLTGGGGVDTLDGGAGDDTLAGGAGVDTYVFRSGGGADTIEGEGEGDDGGILSFVDVDAADIGGFTFSRGDNNNVVITHGSSSATILADAYADGRYTLQVGLGDDLKILGKPKFGTNGNDNGDDALVGTDEGDLLLGLLGDDTLEGGGGADTLFGGAQQDILKGDAGNDRLYGGDGGDTLMGGANDDTLDGGLLDDILYGGGGEDTYVFRGDFGADTIKEDTDGGILRFVDATSLADLTFALDTTTNTLVISLGDNSVVIENYVNELFGLSYGSGSAVTTLGRLAVATTEGGTIVASAGDLQDIMVGSIGNDELQGGGGADTLYGGDGGDTLAGGAGEDALYGGLGDDTLEGGADGDTFDGGGGSDTISYAGSVVEGVDVNLGTNSFSGGDAEEDSLLVLGSIENILGSGLVDTLAGDAGDNILRGGVGKDIYAFEGDYGADTIQDATDGGTLRFQDVTSLTDLIFVLQTNGDLLITDASNSVTIEGYADELFGISYGTGDAMMAFDKMTLGTNGNDNGEATLGGAEGVDLLLGLAGDDTLEGGAEDDALYGGDGVDILRGEAGADTLYGGIGNDILEGGTEDDTLEGGAGADTFDGGGGIDTISYAGSADGVSVNLGTNSFADGDAAGDSIAEGADGSIENLRGSIYDDTLTGDTRANTLYGGDGVDTLQGGAHADTLYGGDGVDTLQGGAGDDILYGGDGGDNLYGGAHYDTLYGGAGADRLEGGEGNDALDGGAGADTYVFSGDFGADTIQGDDGDAVGSINKLYFRDADRFSISVVREADGGIKIDTSGGNSVTIAAASYADGRYSIHYGDSDTLLTTLSVPIIVEGTAGVVEGTAGLVEGTAGNDFLLGLAEGHTYRGYAGDDIIYGDAGDDYLFGDEGDDTLRGGDGVDTLYGGGGVDNLYGGADNDVLYGDADDDILYGGEGDDSRIDGGEGNDILYGGEGHDTLYGGEGEGNVGNDILYGGVGNDKLYGGEGDDILEGGAGHDRFDGGAGFDTISYANSDVLVKINLRNNKFEGGHAQGDKLIDSAKKNIEHIIGSDHDDTLERHHDGDNSFSGGKGADTYVITNGFMDGEEAHLTIQGDENDGDGVENLIDIRWGADSSYDIERLANDDVLITLRDGHLITILASSYADGRYRIDQSDNDAGSVLSFSTPIVDGVVQGTEGNDLLLGLAGGHEYQGLGGSDVIFGGAGDDILRGGDGADTLRGGDGDDILEGGKSDGGASTGGRGKGDIFYGGSGSDTITYENSDAGVNVNLLTNSFSDSEINNVSDAGGDMLAGHDGNTVASIENVRGSAHDDQLTGDDQNNILYGGVGADDLEGGAGNDILHGDADNDHLNGDAGNDILNGGAGADSYYFDIGHGTDSILSDDLNGGQNRIILRGWTDHSLIFSIDRKINGDITIATGGNNSITIAAASYADDRFGLFHGNNAISIGTLNFATANNDGAIEGDANPNLLIGSTGSETLRGLDGNDHLYGGAGDDTIIGGAGNDRLGGGRGIDSYIFNSGDGTDYIYEIRGENNLFFKDIDDVGDFSFTSEIPVGLPEEQVSLHYGSDALVFLRGENDPLFVDGRYSVYHGSEDNLLGKLFIVGTTGSADADFILGDATDNVITGGGGADTLVGGAGADTYIFNRGDGADTIQGETDGGILYFTDMIKYDVSNIRIAINNEGDVKLSFGSDSVVIAAASYANDRYSIQYSVSDNAGGTTQTLAGKLRFGTDGEDASLQGSGDADLIFGLKGGDTIRGSSGDDYIFGNKGHDNLYGDAGDDTLVGGRGTDILDGGAGADTYVFEVGGGADSVSDTSNDELTLLFQGAHYEAADFREASNNFNRVGNNLEITLDKNSDDGIVDKVTILNAYDTDPNTGTGVSAFSIHVAYGSEGAFTEVGSDFWQDLS